MDTAKATQSANEIDLTPRGCQTQDGVVRVNAATKALDEATSRCANVLADIYTEMGGSVAGDTVRDVWRNHIVEIKGAVIARREATAEFLNALTGKSADRIPPKAVR